MRTRNALAVGATAVILAAAGAGTALVASNDSTTGAVASTPSMGCNDWAVTLTLGECQAAGIIRYVALVNIQGAAQFCKWRSANPGEWTRIKGYASTATIPTNIVTWFGSSLRDEVQAYLITGAPTFTMPTNTAPNACSGKLVKPPVIVGVEPGQTDATVTVTTTP